MDFSCSICKKKLKSMHKQAEHYLKKHLSKKCEDKNFVNKPLTPYKNKIQDDENVQSLDDAQDDARGLYEDWYNPDGGNEDYEGGD